MLLLVTVIVLTALASSALTLSLGYWMFQKRIRPRLEAELNDKLERTTEEIEERVRRGVIEGLRSVARGEPLRDTTRQVAQTGAEMFEAGLNNIFGKNNRRRGPGEED